MPTVHRLASTASAPAYTRRRYITTGRALLVSTLSGVICFLAGASVGADVVPKADAKQTPTRKGFEAALAEIRSVLPADSVSTDEDDLIQYGTSEWTYHRASAWPGAVLYPRSTDDVVAIVKAARRHAIPLVPYAGGTSLEAHTYAPEPANHDKDAPLAPGLSFTISFDAMDKIIEVHDKDLDVVVQPGVRYETLNEELAKQQLLFPVDPGPGAAIGGMIATGCSGTNAVRYGTMRDNVLNLTVVLSDGSVIKTRSRAKKSSAGPDLTKLFVGSEGALAIVTEATLKLQPLLPYSVAVSSFPSVQHAADAVAEVVRTGIQVQCIELLDDLMISCVKKANPGDATFAKLQDKDTLFIKLAGTEEQIASDGKRAAEILKRHGGSKMIFARTEQEKQDLWRARKVALWSAMDSLPGSRCWTTDVCVPVSRLPQLVKAVKEDAARRGLVMPLVGHVGDGNIHGLILFRNEEELARVKEAVHEQVRIALALDGTCTGEHGCGLGKLQYLPDELGPGTVALLAQIKHLLDPAGVMNPGKLVPVSE